MHATSRSRRTTAEQRVKNPNWATARRSRLIGLGLIACTLAIAIGFAVTGNSPQPKKAVTVPHAFPKGDVTVSFSSVAQTIDPAAIGVDESTYGTPPDNVDPKAQKLLKVLGVGYSRLWVNLADPANPKSQIICGAAGCDSSVNIADWIHTMRAAGEVPVVGFPDTLSAADAAAIVTQLAVTASDPVEYWVIGNEPNVGNQESAATYSAHFNTLYDAMKHADPSIKIGGPATLGFDQSWIQTFLADCGSRTDFVDFHYYPGYPGSETQAQLPGMLTQLSADLATLRTMIKTAAPTRTSSIGIHVGEWNISANTQSLDQFAYTGIASAFDADLLGRILAGGGDSLAWGSKNGPMSVLYGDGQSGPAGYNPDTPMPLYEAIGMFTGEGRFPRFGTTMVTATSILPNVDVFASKSPDQIVIVNMGSSAQRATVSIQSFAPKHATVWQIHQAGATPAPPAEVGTVTNENGIFKVELPGYSVTTLVLTTQVSDRK